MKTALYIFMALVSNCVFFQSLAKAPLHTAYKDSAAFYKNEVTALNYKVDILQSRIDQAAQTISNQNSLISGFGTIYMVISIVIGFITIGLPVFTYLFSIKPSREALKDLEKEMNARFEKYLSETRDRLIDSALTELEKINGPKGKQAKARQIIAFEVPLGITDKQILRILKIIRLTEDSATKHTLIQVLAIAEENLIIENHFRSTFTKDPFDAATFSYPILYFVDNSIEKFYDIICESVNNSDNPGHTLSTILGCIKDNSSKEKVIQVVNDKSFVDLLNSSTFNSIKLIRLCEMGWLSEEDCKKSLLYEKISAV